MWCGAGLVTQLGPTLGTPRAAAHQAPLSMGFPRQDYWSGLTFPSPGDLPDPGTELASSALQADSFTVELPRSPKSTIQQQKTEERVKETEIQKEDRREKERPLQFACLALLIYSSFI